MTANGPPTVVASADPADSSGEEVVAAPPWPIRSMVFRRVVAEGAAVEEDETLFEIKADSDVEGYSGVMGLPSPRAATVRFLCEDGAAVRPGTPLVRLEYRTP